MSRDTRAKMVGPIKRWDDVRQFQIKFLKENGLKPEHKYADIGCGVLRGGIPIIDYLDEGNYYGFESRGEVLREGRKELNENKLQHKEPTLIRNGSFDEITLDVKFDMVLAYSVLFHMTDNIVEACLRFVGRHLAEDGTFFANVNIGKHENLAKKGDWQGFPVMSRQLSWYRRVSERAGLTRFETIGNVGDWGFTGILKSPSTKPILKLGR